MPFSAYDRRIITATGSEAGSRSGESRPACAGSMHPPVRAEAAMAVSEPVDSAKLQAFMGQALGDLGGLVSASLVVIGDKLGLYRALAEAGPLTSAELAARTGTTERYVREWLINQAAGGYLGYDTASGRYSLPPEQALALTDGESPFFLAGAFQLFVAMSRATPRILEAFRTGAGMTWGEHDAELFEGTERFFRPGYAANLVAAWLPALDGVVGKLEAGATVADVGCGHGASTIILAEAFPRSRFVGFDSHAPSIARARAAAAAAGVEGYTRFEVASAQDYPGSAYDLVAYFDCLHDMATPWAPRATPTRRWRQTARCCWSSRWRGRESRRTSTRSGASSRAHPSCAARRTPWPPAARAPRSAPSRRTRRCATCSPGPALPASAARPRRRSTESSRPASSGRLPPGVQGSTSSGGSASSASAGTSSRVYRPARPCARIRQRSRSMRKESCTSSTLLCSPR